MQKQICLQFKDAMEESNQTEGVHIPVNSIKKQKV